MKGRLGIAAVSIVTVGLDGTGLAVCGAERLGIDKVTASNVDLVAAGQCKCGILELILAALMMTRRIVVMGRR